VRIGIFEGQILAIEFLIWMAIERYPEATAELLRRPST